MGIKQILICDVFHEQDDEEEVEAAQRVAIQVPLLKKQWVGEVCEDCYENLPLARIIDELGSRLTKTSIAMGLESLPEIPSMNGNGHHARELPDITCEECGMEMKGIPGYAAHWRNMHGGDFPGFGDLVCPDCGYKCLNRKVLAAHLRTAHGVSKENRKPRHEKALAG
jgi:hypothetical protein